ncbi:MAG: phosphopantothenoylcysteine decarboxylase [Verrucomicrobiota bacterium]|nr:phosphopantothenoylcysteine decarboxylase [Verrucomicrobiota bacterium]
MIIVTCGPSYEPIDQVRRLTNSSTGELGILLASRLATRGFDVTCFKGVGATCCDRLDGATLRSFTTTEDLRAALAAVEKRDTVRAVFHAAALCDFRVKRMTAAGWAETAVAKIPSQAGELTLTLEPAAKLIAELRSLFPASRIVGWKYELSGPPESALHKAREQMRVNGTDACVLNGSAYGVGFGFCEPGEDLVHCADKPALCAFLVQWLERALRRLTTGGR